MRSQDSILTLSFFTVKLRVVYVIPTSALTEKVNTEEVIRGHS
jgi:hypothetical protein